MKLDEKEQLGKCLLLLLKQEDPVKLLAGQDGQVLLLLLELKRPRQDGQVLLQLLGLKKPRQDGQVLLQLLGLKKPGHVLMEKSEAGLSGSESVGG